MKQLPEPESQKTDLKDSPEETSSGPQITRNRKSRPRPKPSVKAKAVSYLARREHSQLELVRKLSRAGYDQADIQEAITWLAKHELQSNERFVRSLARRRAGTYGDRAIDAELAQHGLSRDPAPIDDNFSNDVLPDALAFDQPPVSDTPDLLPEPERILQWLNRKYTTRLTKVLNEEGELDREALFQLKIKAYRALGARGFEQNNIQTSWTRFINEFVNERC